MHRPRTLLTLLIGINITIMVLSAMSIIDSLADGPNALDLLMVATRVVTIVCALLMIVQGTSLVMAILRIDQTTDLETLELLLERIERSSTWLAVLSSLFIWSVVASNLVNAVQHLRDGEIPRALVDVALAGILAWLNLRSGGQGGRGKSVGKLIGEKSRALVDRLVETQKGMQPEPSPA